MLPDAAIAQQHHNDEHVARVGDHKRRADDGGKQAGQKAAQHAARREREKAPGDCAQHEWYTSDMLHTSMQETTD